MVTITIDGKQISVDENLSILEAAQEADVKIPTLCYLKDVNEVGACIEKRTGKFRPSFCNFFLRIAPSARLIAFGDQVLARSLICRLVFILNRADAGA